MEVRDFYERMPYPAPFTSLDDHRDLYRNPDRRRALFHLTWPSEPLRGQEEILVAGCGTSRAARYALRDPDARITAIDISETSLRHTRELQRVTSSPGVSDSPSVLRSGSIQIESGSTPIDMHAPVPSSDPQPASASVRQPAQTVLIYGVVGGILILALKLGEYRFLVLEHSVEIYGALVAAMFAVLGIWLGQTLTRKKSEVPIHGLVIKDLVVQEVVDAVAAAGSAGRFVPKAERVQAIGLTPRELEILGLIAGGLSNREIATMLFVSENTVKTHSSRLFDKLGAKRRTQAVQIGQSEGLIP